MRKIALHQLKEQRFMRELPAQFEGTRDQKAYVFNQLTRINDIAVYEKWLKGTQRKGLTYEVFRVKKHEAGQYTIAGKTVNTEAKESMPSPEEWGTNGWSYVSECNAMAKMDELVRTESLTVKPPTPTRKSIPTCQR